MILTYFPLASTILFGFSFISLAWLSTHLHDYYGRLWQYIYSGARVYDSRTCCTMYSLWSRDYAHYNKTKCTRASDIGVLHVYVLKSKSVQVKVPYKIPALN